MNNEPDFTVVLSEIRLRAERLHYSLRTRLVNAEEALDAIRSAPVVLNPYNTLESVTREATRLREQLYSWQTMARAALMENDREEARVREEIRQAREEAGE